MLSVPELQLKVTEQRRFQALRGTILLAEDEASVRALVKRVLVRAGYVVLEAADGREAAQLWREHASEIDMILTDLIMPEVGGRNLIAQLLVDRPNLRFLFMSGFTGDGCGSPELEAGAFNFLEKPFGPAKLVEKIEEILRS